MLRKQVLVAVIGGVVGAVLVMAAGEMSPAVKDAEFRVVTCRRLDVVNGLGKSVVRMSAGRNGGYVTVADREGNEKLALVVG